MEQKAPLARAIGDGVHFGANQIAGAGLFYGGGFKQLGLQLLGMFATAAWTAVSITIAFRVIKAIFGLRVGEEEEILGLDSTEHGLPSAYAGFQIVDLSTGMQINENTDLGEEAYERASDFKKNAAVPVIRSEHIGNSTGMYKVSIVAKHSRYEKLKNGLNDVE